MKGIYQSLIIARIGPSRLQGTALSSGLEAHSDSVCGQGG
jgi:hypothetical protein